MKNSILKGRPIILGEVLFDQFLDGESVLGGAPFNVAWHLKGFGADPLFISRVGKDDPGEKVRKAMQDWGMDRAGLQQDDRYPTGTVRITLDAGQPTFDILPDQAYDHMDAMTGAISAAVSEGGLLYHGSLILRTEAMRDRLEALLATATSTQGRLPIFVDINLRAPWWNESDIPAILRRARWAKVNEDELAIIAKPLDCRTDDFTEMARRVRAICELHLLIVTLGAQGAVAFDALGGVFPVSPDDPDQAIVDTVGAGDAFSTVVIMGLLHGWSLPTMMQRAQRFAGRVCQLRGATTTDVDFYRQ